MDQRKPPSSSTGATVSRAWRPQSIFTVDVEDWFHILDLRSTPELQIWDKLPSRVEANFYRLLDLFSARQVNVTCFFLGWIGERFPYLVREAVKRGHEIASHGYAHRLVCETGRDEFYEDALRSRELLEDISGSAVADTAPLASQSNTKRCGSSTSLAAAGYQNDPSVFPANKGYGGMPKAHRTPYRVVRLSRSS